MKNWKVYETVTDTMLTKNGLNYFRPLVNGWIKWVSEDGTGSRHPSNEVRTCGSVAPPDTQDNIRAGNHYGSSLFYIMWKDCLGDCEKRGRVQGPAPTGCRWPHRVGENFVGGFFGGAV